MDASDEEEDDDQFQVPEIAPQRASPKQSRTTPHQSDAASDVTMQSLPSEKQKSEARIVAPHVSKLSPHSAVEIRLQSPTECVAVLCAVDVLKMRSGFFHDVLSEQEATTPQIAECQQQGNNSRSEGLHELNPNMLWRQPIVVPENSPFEAAAYLESLHEGRALFRGEWNLCWARLRF